MLCFWELRSQYKGAGLLLVSMKIKATELVRLSGIFYLTCFGQRPLSFIFVIDLAAEQNSPAHHRQGLLSKL